MSNSSTGGHIYDFLSTGSANTGGAGRLDLYDFTAGAARLSIAANGNIGVGTTTPDTTLTITSSGANGIDLAADQGTPVNSERLFFSDNTANTAFALMNSGGNFEVRSGASAGNNAGTPQFELTSTVATFPNASVGIGTTTPYSRLEVWGPDTASTSRFRRRQLRIDDRVHRLRHRQRDARGQPHPKLRQRLKTNINGLDGSSSLAAINALNPVTFNWIDPDQEHHAAVRLHRPAGADDLPQPRLNDVTDRAHARRTLSLNYIELISPIVAAIQELDKEITSLASTVAGLRA